MAGNVIFFHYWFNLSMAVILTADLDLLLKTLRKVEGEYKRETSWCFHASTF